MTICNDNKILAKVNCFKISLPEVERFYHYDVEITPKVVGTRRRREIMTHLQVVSRPEIFCEVITAFDGQKNLFTYPHLPIDNGHCIIDVNMAENTNQGIVHRRPIYRVSIVETTTEGVKTDELSHAITGHIPAVMSLTALQILNILVQQSASSKYPFSATTRNSIYMEEGKAVHSGLEFWRGFYQSARIVQGQVVLNVDITTTAMYPSGPLIGVAQGLLGLKNSKSLSTLDKASSAFRILKSVLNKVRVRSRYQDKPDRLYVVAGVVVNAGRYEFTLDNGEKTTVAEYYRKALGIRLQKPEMPGILTAFGAVIPFERCEVIPGQLYVKQLPPDVFESLVEFATVKPEKRFKMIMQGMKDLGHESKQLALLGIRVSTNPLEVSGKLLVPPPIKYNGGLLASPSNGKWSLLRRKFVEPKRIRAWSVISFADIDIQHVKDFASSLESCMIKLGMRVDTQPAFLLGNCQGNIGRQMVVAGTRAIENTGMTRPDILVAILPPNSTPLRVSIKQFGDMLFDVPTQCICSKNILGSKYSGSFCNNVLMKINAKLGGVNAYVDPKYLQWVRSAPTMIFGADVGHPGRGILRPSVAGLVGSVDMEVSRYTAICSVQAPRVEMIQDLKGMVQTLLQDFHEYWLRQKKSLWPKQILFYRDGVSEGEMKQVLEIELPQIRDAAKEMLEWRGDPPKITIVVVKKNHHIRFAPVNQQEGDDNGNCPAGFLVDDTITYPRSENNYRDFFLQAHSSLLGTSRPAPYVVFTDECSLDFKCLQELSFALCHASARSTRSISIPVPVYYADLVCSRAQFHFDPALVSAIEEGDDGSDPFDISQWIKAFKNAGPTQRRKMYFL